MFAHFFDKRSIYSVSSISRRTNCVNHTLLHKQKISSSTPYGITENPCIEDSLRLEFQKDNAKLLSGVYLTIPVRIQLLRCKSRIFQIKSFLSGNFFIIINFHCSIRCSRDKIKTSVSGWYRIMEECKWNRCICQSSPWKPGSGSNSCFRSRTIRSAKSRVLSALRTHRQSTSGSPGNHCQAWTTLSFSADYYIPALKISSSLTGIFLVYGPV